VSTSALTDWISNSAALITGSAVIVAAFVGAYRKALIVSKKLAAIHDELVPNGGSSLRDAINRIEALQITALALTGKAHWISGPDGHCTFASVRLAGLMGLTPEQVEGWGWVTAVAPEYREACRREWDNAVKDLREFHMKYEYIRPNGERVPISGHAIPIVHAQTKAFVGMLGWAEPIEEKKP
jgi:PAS domain S-box-containing protein